MKHLTSFAGIDLDNRMHGYTSICNAIHYTLYHALYRPGLTAENLVDRTVIPMPGLMPGLMLGEEGT